MTSPLNLDGMYLTCSMTMLLKFITKVKPGSFTTLGDFEWIKHMDICCRQQGMNHVFFRACVIVRNAHRVDEVDLVSFLNQTFIFGS